MNAKLNVVLTPATPSVGLIDAQPGMPLVEGRLTAVSGNVVTVTRTDGSVFRDYAHNLRILALDAAGYGWPGAPECIRFGHGGGTGPAMVPSWRIGASPFETANPDELQTIRHGDGKPRACRLGVSEAEDVAPVPACRGAVIGWAALATLLRRPAPWPLSLRTRGRCEVLMNYAGGVWATRPRPINCLRTSTDLRQAPTPMKILIQPLQEDTEVGATLRDDGWAVTVGQGGLLSATHRDVPDEEAARRRLQSLGLLTTTSVRIDFPRTDG